MSFLVILLLKCLLNVCDTIFFFFIRMYYYLFVCEEQGCGVLGERHGKSVQAREQLLGDSSLSLPYLGMELSS